MHINRKAADGHKNTQIKESHRFSIYKLYAIIPYSSIPLHCGTGTGFVVSLVKRMYMNIKTAALIWAKLFLQVFGVEYFLSGVFGLLKIGAGGITKVLGFLHVNGADNFLHIRLGVFIFLAGTILGRSNVILS